MGRSIRAGKGGTKQLIRTSSITRVGKFYIGHSPLARSPREARLWGVPQEGLASKDRGRLTRSVVRCKEESSRQALALPALLLEFASVRSRLDRWIVPSASFPSHSYFYLLMELATDEN